MKQHSSYFELICTGINSDVTKHICAMDGILLLGFGTRSRMIKDAEDRRHKVTCVQDVTIGVLSSEAARDFIKSCPTIILKSTRIRGMLDSTWWQTLTMISDLNKGQLSALGLVTHD